jgi:short-subunit dehydrogenase
MTAMLFEDTTVLITGASSGIGAAFANELAPTGARLVLAGRDQVRLEAVATRARQHGAPVVTIGLDLAAPGGISALLQRLDVDGVTVDHLINNAGAGVVGRAVRTPVEAQLKVIDLNAHATTELALRLLPGMVERRRGGVLNIASIAAFQGMPGLAVYAATKAYVLAWSEALNFELRGTGVRCACLCPGPVDSRFFDAAGMRKPPAIFSMQSPVAVARAGLRAYERNASHSMSGSVPRVLAWLTRLTPRRINAAAASGFSRPRKTP